MQKIKRDHTHGVRFMFACVGGRAVGGGVGRALTHAGTDRRYGSYLVLVIVSLI